MSAAKVSGRMRYAPRALLAGWLGFAAAFLVACGANSGLLSSDQASNLNAQLDQVSSDVSAGQCQAATSAAQSFRDAVANLGSVSGTLTTYLKQGAATITELAARQCRQQTPAAQTSSTPMTPTVTSTTASTPTSSTATSTTPTTSTPTQTTTAPATTTSGPGTTSTSGGSGGAGIGAGGGANGSARPGGAGPASTGNGNG
ncbi:MAG: hypothetical protein ACYC91_09080 [Solirubrobacteraceae bacterium]